MPHNLNPSELNEKLIEIATRDGNISADEKAILENVRKNITKYFKVLHESYDDDIITSEEQNSMYTIRKKIMDEALEVAKEDNKVTQEEFALLNTIRSILEEMEYNEHY